MKMSLPEFQEAIARACSSEDRRLFGAGIRLFEKSYLSIPEIIALIREVHETGRGSGNVRG